MLRNISTFSFTTWYLQERLTGNNFIVQHDNDPECSANIVKKIWNRDLSGLLTVLGLPPQSSYLNIIEAMWDY